MKNLTNKNNNKDQGPWLLNASTQVKKYTIITTISKRITSPYYMEITTTKHVHSLSMRIQQNVKTKITLPSKKQKKNKIYRKNWI